MKKLLLIMGVVLLHFDSLAQCANANKIYSFTANGKRYELVRENRTWTQAYTCAQSRGGYLAEINSSAENSALLTALLSQAAGITLGQTTDNDGGGGSYVWLGGHDIPMEGIWIWDGSQGRGFWNGGPNGSSVGGAYQNWGVSSKGWRSEPDNAMNQDALGFALSSWPPGSSITLGVAGMWNDVDVDNNLYYLIEFDGGCTETSSTITKSICDSYTSPSGKKWTTTGTYNDTIDNSAGCDSVITINLTILSETYNSVSESVCNTFTSPSGKIWTTSGTYNDIIDNAVGCDSVITIHLTVLYGSRSTIDVSSCEFYTSPSGKTWTTTGTYNDTMPNAVGCDSVITMNLTILSSTQSTSNISSCSAFTSPSGKIWTASGTYLDTILNSAGCDSIMTFNLTIVSVDNGVTKNKDSLIASSGGSYQWLDCENNFSVISGATNQRYIPSQDGEYAVEVTESGCVDTSNCVIVALSSVEDFDDNQIRIYPNPTSDMIQIMMENSQPIDGFSVYDVLGKEYEVKLTKLQNRYEVNLKDLPSGTYVLVIDSQGKQIIRQIQKL